MKAAYITETGAPEALRYDDLPDPVPGSGEVLVRVGAVAVNPIDTYIRSGAVALPIEFPYIIGCDLAGTVEAVGEGVTRFRPGDRVWGSNQGLAGRPGTFAELAAVGEEWLYPTPDGWDDEAAAAGALVGITAHLGLHLHAGLQPGETVFVNGGTGGVGASVVQLAKAAGARVVATVGNEEKAARCTELGADLVLDYHLDDLDDRIRDFAGVQADGAGIDVWYETQREPTVARTIGLMRKRGRIVLMAGRTAEPSFPLGQFYTNDLSLRGFAMFNASPDEQRIAAEAINALAANGDWQVTIGARFPLAEAAEAHRLQERNTLEKAGTLTGKIVLAP